MSQDSPITPEQRSVRPAGKRPGKPMTGGVKLLISALSVAGTLGGWAALSAASTPAGQTSASPTTAAIIAPDTLPPIAFEPLPTVVPLIQMAHVPVPVIEAAPAAPAPAAQAPAQIAPIQAAPVTPPMRSVVRPPNPVAVSRSSG